MSQFFCTLLLTTLIAVACNEPRDKPHWKPKAELPPNTDSLQAIVRLKVLRTEYSTAQIWDSLDFDFTYHYQKSIDSAPVIVFRRIDLIDLWQTDSLFHLRVAVNKPFGPDGLLELTTKNSSMIARLVPEPSRDWSRRWEDDEEWWLIARIDALTRPRFKVITEVSEDEFNDRERCSAELVLTSTTPLILKGELLAIIDSNGVHSARHKILQ